MSCPILKILKIPLFWKLFWWKLENQFKELNSKLFLFTLSFYGFLILPLFVIGYKTTGVSQAGPFSKAHVIFLTVFSAKDQTNQTRRHQSQISPLNKLFSLRHFWHFTFVYTDWLPRTDVVNRFQGQRFVVLQSYPHRPLDRCVTGIAQAILYVLFVAADIDKCYPIISIHWVGFKF